MSDARYHASGYPMRDKVFATILHLLVFAVLIAVPSSAQTGPDGWTPPRTPEGRPDLQGVWTNATITPFERGNSMPYSGVAFPESATDRTVFTEEESARLEAQTVAGRLDVLGAYNVWMDAGNRLLSTRQTSLVVDPPDGRVPVKAWAAAAREHDISRQRDEYNAMSTWDRCITRGVPGSMLPTGYNNAYRIVQTPDVVAIQYEMIHDVRVIPVTDNAHAGEGVELWMGDARAHWEGDTLVVDTTNFNDQTMIVTSSRDGRLKGLPVGDAMHVVERFTRVSEDELMWEVTVDDPDVYDRPWTLSMPLTRAGNYVMYEYACHEGNQDVGIYLGGGRAEELAGR